VWSRVDAVPFLDGRVRPGPRREWLASHVAGVATAAFVAGGATGAAVYASLEKPAPARIVYVDRPAISVPVASAVPPPAPEPAPSAAPSAPVALPPAPAVPSSTSTSLSAERALIDSARAALTSGDAAAALALLDSHARRFPRPQLTEEREALRIQSLVTLGRYDEARATAARFRASSPGSLFMPAIEASLGSIP
jgi:hypothetical protein